MANTAVKTTFVVLVFASAWSAQVFEGRSHYARVPFVVDEVAGSVEQFSLASDAELSVIAYREAPSEAVYARTNDGRGLAPDAGLNSGWSPSFPLAGTAGIPRRLERDSVQSVGGSAYVVWMDDDSGSASTRLRYRVHSGGAWGPLLAVSTAGYPALADVVGFSFVGKRGLNGQTYLYLLTRIDVQGTGHLVLSISPDGGASFLPAIPVADGGVAPAGTGGAVLGQSVDSQLAELYVAWTDDRSGRSSVYFRRGIVGFLGEVTWLAGESELLTAALPASVSGAPIVAVNGSFAWTGTNQKMVGVAWRQDDGDGTRSLQLRASLDSGATFQPTLLAPHTDVPALLVGEFDFEVISAEFVLTWDDNAESDGLGGVNVMLPGGTHCWRAESGDGVQFDPEQQLSGQESPTDRGLSPKIARAVGTPDGTAIAFLERTAALSRVASAFGDQEFGGEWHDEYPVVSTGEPGILSVRDPDLAYNRLYYNFIMAWRQETSSGSGVFDLIVGGYRPHDVTIRDWYEGTSSIHFEIGHLPFQDTYGFVLVSLGANNAFGGNLIAPDGRKLGLIADDFTVFGVTNFQYFFGVNDPNNEGVVTPNLPIVLPPSITVGFPISYVGLTWGPFGDFHVITDHFTALLEPAPVN